MILADRIPYRRRTCWFRPSTAVITGGTCSKGCLSQTVPVNESYLKCRGEVRRWLKSKCNGTRRYDVHLAIHQPVAALTALDHVFQNEAGQDPPVFSPLIAAPPHAPHLDPRKIYCLRGGHASMGDGSRNRDDGSEGELGPVKSLYRCEHPECVSSTGQQKLGRETVLRYWPANVARQADQLVPTVYRILTGKFDSSPSPFVFS